MGKQTAQQNQTGNELVQAWGIGRDGVGKMLDTMQGELRAVAAPNVVGAFDTWKMRAFVDIVNNDAIADVIKTRPGMLSVYQGLAKAAVMGLQIGGQYPQAYFVPKSGKAIMIPTRDGYAFSATYGPGAVLDKWPELHRVYEKDKFRLDDAARTYAHEYEPFADRGKLVGYFTILEYRDGRRIVRHITQEKVRALQSAYKMSDGPAFKKSPDEMDEKTALKWMLRDAVRESEGLAMLITLDEEADGQAAEPAPLRDVTERVGARLDAAVTTVGPGTEAETADAETVEGGEQTEDDPPPETDADKPKELF